MAKSKVWTLNNQFNGIPKLSDFKMIEEDLPDKLGKGEILCEVLHLSVDPYMRSGELKMEIGSTIFGESISKVIISENPDYPVGSIVRSFSGWRSHIYIKEIRTQPSPEGMPPTVGRMPEMGDLPKSLALGIMGMTGLTAYFGTLEVLKPKEGETLVVSGAAGAVGSIVGQIAKIKGCRVVGSAGTDEKCAWLKSLGFDEAFNYKNVKVDAALKQAAPNGIDLYFDNVGGDFTNTVLHNMKFSGRIAVCGQISTYNDTKETLVPNPFMQIIGRQLKVEGFNVMMWIPKWPEGEKELSKWIKEGKIKYKETVTEGFENMPEAFIGLFEGSNTGKAIVNT